VNLRGSETVKSKAVTNADWPAINSIGIARPDVSFSEAGEASFSRGEKKESGMKREFRRANRMCGFGGLRDFHKAFPGGSVRTTYEEENRTGRERNGSGESGRNGVSG
jgi:hypothetical protein